MTRRRPCGLGPGNSNAFRAGDREASWRVIEMFQQHGSKFIDCRGPSRFVAADVVQERGLGNGVFPGTYFDLADEAASRD